MQPQTPSPPCAAYVASVGRDDAVAIAWPWLVTQARRHNGVITIVSALESSVTTMESTLGAPAVRELLAGGTVDHDRVRIRARVVGREVPGGLDGEVILALWLTDSELGLVDAAKPAAIAFIPWMNGEGSAWIGERQAIELRSRLREAQS